MTFLQVDLKDEEFHRHALAASQSMRDGIKALIRDAIAAGELNRGDAGRLAAALHATMNGSLLNWAVHRQGSLAAYVPEGPEHGARAVSHGRARPEAPSLEPQAASPPPPPKAPAGLAVAEGAGRKPHAPSRCRKLKVSPWLAPRH